MKAVLCLLGVAALLLVVWMWSSDRSTPANASPPAGGTDAPQADRAQLEAAHDLVTDARVSTSESGPPSTIEPASDPCARLRTEFAAKEAELRHKVEALRSNEGRTPIEHLATLPDAELLDERGRKFLEALLVSDLPFYLRPGEALWIAEYEATQPWSTADVIRFLGPQRLLAEAPPSWIELRKGFHDDAEWLAIFGTPKPPD